MNSKIPCMRQCHWRCHQTFFSDYWLCKIPWNEILTTWLYQRPWKDTNFVEILIRKTIIYWQTSHIHRPYLIDNGCQPRLQFNSVCLIYFFFFHSYLDFLFRWWFDEHRASIEGKSPYKESYTVDSHWKMFCDVYQPNVA